MSYFKAKMHQIRFRLGLRPRPHWGSSQRWIKGVLLLREGEGGERKGVRGGEERQRGGGVMALGVDALKSRPTVISKSWRLCTERLSSSLPTPFSLRLSNSGVMFLV